MNIQKFADAVRKNGWMVRQVGSVTEMYKKIDKKKQKIVSVFIRRITDKYIIEFPQHAFVSKVATFAPAVEREQRLCRSASVIGSIYESLKGTEICNMIDNWSDWVIINPYNKNVHKSWATDRLNKWKKKV
jgi:hypothetical protein